MEGPLRKFAGRRRREALDTLARDLATFAPEGLARLRDDLATGRVGRGSWDGCVLSYRHGGPGSSRRDARGRPRNPFTVAWDAGEITDEEVLEALGQELGRRPGRSPHQARRRDASGPHPVGPSPMSAHRSGALQNGAPCRDLPRGPATRLPRPSRPTPCAPGPRNGGPVEGAP